MADIASPTAATATDTGPAPAPPARPKGRYHSDQITAHWTVVFLVLFQLATGGAMEAAMDLGYAAGELPKAGVIFVHGILGSSILAVMLWRVTLRLRYGAPPPPDSVSRPIQVISRLNHYAFYGVLITMPLLGLAAVLTLSPTIGALHAIFALLLILLALAHVAGAVMHIVKRDGTIKRVLSGQPPRVLVPPAERHGGRIN